MPSSIESTYEKLTRTPVFAIVAFVAVAFMLGTSIPADWSLKKWYWERKAQIPHLIPQPRHKDEIVARLFDWIGYQLVELWNALLLREPVRYALFLALGAIAAGFLSKLGGDLYARYKNNPSSKEKV
jgi:hypothetical protein